MKEMISSQCLYAAHPPMPEVPTTILLVTPVWKDSSRLADFGAELAQALAASPLPVRWIIADDGSGDTEKARLLELRTGFAKIFPNVEVHFAKEHRGKGSVVREAWALDLAAEWLAFVDADGSVTAHDMLDLITEAIAANQSVLGIRKRTATTQLIESPWRGFIHRGFLLMARLLLGFRCEDLQCGGKIIRGKDYRQVMDGLVENGLAFDSELLCALHRSGAKWLEIPVSWEEKKGGKVKPIWDALPMLMALLRIRFQKHQDAP